MTPVDPQANILQQIATYQACIAASNWRILASDGEYGCAYYDRPSPHRRVAELVDEPAL